MTQEKPSGFWPEGFSLLVWFQKFGSVLLAPDHRSEVHFSREFLVLSAEGILLDSGEVGNQGADLLQGKDQILRTSAYPDGMVENLVSLKVKREGFRLDVILPNLHRAVCYHFGCVTFPRETAPEVTAPGPFGLLGGESLVSRAHCHQGFLEFPLAQLDFEDYVLNLALTGPVETDGLGNVSRPVPNCLGREVENLFRGQRGFRLGDCLVRVCHCGS